MEGFLDEPTSLAKLNPFNDMTIYDWVTKDFNTKSISKINPIYIICPPSSKWLAKVLVIQSDNFRTQIFLTF